MKEGESFGKGRRAEKGGGRGSPRVFRSMKVIVVARTSLVPLREREEDGERGA